MERRTRIVRGPELHHRRDRHTRPGRRCRRGRRRRIARREARRATHRHTTSRDTRRDQQRCSRRHSSCALPSASETSLVHVPHNTGSTGDRANVRRHRHHRRARRRQNAFSVQRGAELLPRQQRCNRTVAFRCGGGDDPAHRNKVRAAQRALLEVRAFIVRRWFVDQRRNPFRREVLHSRLPESVWTGGPSEARAGDATSPGP